MDDKVLEQGSNVASLPDLVGSALTMPRLWHTLLDGRESST